MSLPPRVGRVLYRSIVRGADKLTREFERCCTSGFLRARELDEMKRHVGVSMPKDIRGLLDVHPYPSDLRNYIGITTRRLVDANVAPELEGIDGLVGFDTLKYINSRLHILAQIGTNTSSTNIPPLNNNNTNTNNTNNNENIINNTNNSSNDQVRISSSSSFVGYRKSKFQFRYNVAIENMSRHTIKLLSRFWRVMDLNGNVNVVQGPGINYGLFPSIAPGDTFEYESSCPLLTPLGTQRGYFLFHTLNRNNNDAPELLKVHVEPFTYKTPDSDPVYADPDGLLVPFPISHHRYGAAGNNNNNNKRHGRRRRGGRSKKGGRTTRNKER